MAGCDPPANLTPDSSLTAVLETLGALGIGAVVLNAQRIVVAVNPAFATLAGLGLATAQLTGSHLPDGPATYAHLYADPQAARLRQRSLMDGGRRVSGERSATADGRILEQTYAPITTSGTTTGHLWLMKELEAEQPAGAGNCPPTFSADQVGALTSAIAHEVRTPATSIAAFAAMLDDTDLDSASRHRAADAVRRSADRLLLLSADLVLLSDLERGTRPPADHPDVDLDALLKRAAGRLVAVTVAEAPGAGSDQRASGDARLLLRGFEATIDAAVAIAAESSGGSSGRSSRGSSGRPCPTARVATTPGWWTATIACPLGQPVTPERLLALKVPDRSDPETFRTAALVLLLARTIVRHGGGTMDIVSDQSCFTVKLALPLSSGWAERPAG